MQYVYLLKRVFVIIFHLNSASSLIFMEKYEITQTSTAIYTGLQKFVIKRQPSSLSHFSTGNNNKETIQRYKNTRKNCSRFKGQIISSM